MRLFWLCLGWTFLALGGIGVLLPVMPTVPFLLVAAWAFSRSSPELKARILANPRYGPAIRAWQERGAVSRIAKIWAIFAMSAGVGLGLWLGVANWIVLTQASICLAVAAYLITRPET